MQPGHVRVVGRVVRNDRGRLRRNDQLRRVPSQPEVPEGQALVRPRRKVPNQLRRPWVILRKRDWLHQYLFEIELRAYRVHARVLESAGFNVFDIEHLKEHLAGFRWPGHLEES